MHLSIPKFSLVCRVLAGTLDFHYTAKNLLNSISNMFQGQVPPAIDIIAIATDVAKLVRFFREVLQFHCKLVFNRLS